MRYGAQESLKEISIVNDLADAVCLVTEKYSSSSPINIGSSKEISIEELAQTIAKLLDWGGTFKFNSNMPDGTMLKKLDTTKINKMGWRPKIDIKTGIKNTIKEFINLNYA